MKKWIAVTSVLALALFISPLYPEDMPPEGKFQANLSPDDYRYGFEKISNILQDPTINAFTKGYIISNMHPSLFFRLKKESYIGCLNTFLMEKDYASMGKILKWCCGDYTIPYLMELAKTEEYAQSLTRLILLGSFDRQEALKYLQDDKAFLYKSAHAYFIDREVPCMGIKAEAYLLGLCKEVDKDPQLLDSISKIVDKKVDAKPRDPEYSYMTVKQKRSLLAVAFARVGSRSGVRQLVSFDVESGKPFGTGWTGIRLYKTPVVLDELCEIALQSKDEKAREYALTYLKGLVSIPFEDMTAQGWKTWLQANSGNIFRKGFFLFSLEDGRYFVNRDLIKCNFEVIDIEQYLQELGSGDEKIRNAAREKIIDVFPLAKETLAGRDLSDRECLKDVLVTLKKMIGSSSLIWDGLHFQIADVENLKNIVNSLERSSEEELGQHFREDAKTRDQLCALTLLEFEKPSSVNGKIFRWEKAWFVANEKYIYWDKEKMFYRVDEGAKSAEVPVATWKMIPPEKRQMWASLSDEDKIQIINEAEKKLLEESKAASGGAE